MSSLLIIVTLGITKLAVALQGMRAVRSVSLHLKIQYFLYFGRNAPMLGSRERRDYEWSGMTW